MQAGKSAITVQKNLTNVLFILTTANRAFDTKKKPKFLLFLFKLLSMQREFSRAFEKLYCRRRKYNDVIIN